MYNDGKTYFTNYVDKKFNNVNSNGENVGAINLKVPFHFSFLKNCRNLVQHETSKFLLFEVFGSANKT